MLARSFLTADELGLTEEAHAALIKVLGMLERGELVWTRGNVPIRNGFNMALGFYKDYQEYRGDPECGTVGCIAGWAYFLMGAKRRGDSGIIITQREITGKQQYAFSNLIRPYGYGLGTHTIGQAAHALRTYLTTGEAEWLEA